MRFGVQSLNSRHSSVARCVLTREPKVCFHMCTEVFMPESLQSYLIPINKSVQEHNLNTDVLVETGLFFWRLTNWHSSYLQLQG